MNNTKTRINTIFLIDGMDNDGRACDIIAKAYCKETYSKALYIYLDRSKKVMNAPIWSNECDPEKTRDFEEVMSEIIDNYDLSETGIITGDIAPTEEQYNFLIEFIPSHRIVVCDHHELDYIPTCEHNYNRYKCGATILREFLFIGDEGEELCKYIQDRDLFTKEFNPTTDIIYHAVGKEDRISDDELIDIVYSNDVSKLIEIGKPFYDEYITTCTELSKEYEINMIDGLQCLCYEDVAGLYTSDTLNIGLKNNPQADIALNKKWLDHLGKFAYGMRSIKGKGLDFVKRYGGGGHANGNTGGFSTEELY